MSGVIIFLLLPPFLKDTGIKSSYWGAAPVPSRSWGAAEMVERGGGQALPCVRPGVTGIESNKDARNRSREVKPAREAVHVDARAHGQPGPGTRTPGSGPWTSPCPVWLAPAGQAALVFETRIRGQQALWAEGWEGLWVWEEQSRVHEPGLPSHELSMQILRTLLLFKKNYQGRLFPSSQESPLIVQIQ